MQPDETEANYCNATTSDKYSPNHTLSSNPRNHARSPEHELVAASTAAVVKSQSEFTLSQGKITRAKEEVNSQNIFWLHLANLC